MAKIQLERLPTPPPKYDPMHQTAVNKALQLSLQRVDYSPQNEMVKVTAMTWFGL